MKLDKNDCKKEGKERVKQAIRVYFIFSASTIISAFILTALFSGVIGAKSAIVFFGFSAAVGVGYSIVWCTICQILKVFIKLNYFGVFSAGVLTVYIGNFFWYVDQYGWNLTFDQHISVGIFVFPFGLLSSLILWFVFFKKTKFEVEDNK